MKGKIENLRDDINNSIEELESNYEDHYTLKSNGFDFGQYIAFDRILDELNGILDEEDIKNDKEKIMKEKQDEL